MRDYNNTYFIYISDDKIKLALCGKNPTKELVGSIIRPEYTALGQQLIYSS